MYLPQWMDWRHLQSAYVYSIYKLYDSMTICNSAAVCSPSCKNGGTCSSPNTCTCTEGWNGESCTNGKCDITLYIYSYNPIHISYNMHACCLASNNNNNTREAAIALESLTMHPEE